MIEINETGFLKARELKKDLLSFLTRNKYRNVYGNMWTFVAIYEYNDKYLIHFEHDIDINTMPIIETHVSITVYEEGRRLDNLRMYVDYTSSAVKKIVHFLLLEINKVTHQFEERGLHSKYFEINMVEEGAEDFIKKNIKNVYIKLSRYLLKAGFTSAGAGKVKAGRRYKKL